ncbi:MAG: DUF2442 domain-containing protein [Candidatus Scalindua sp.]|nr:DUF2442 domain-containing protein [Candidatus Scalindua sp.]
MPTLTNRKTQTVCATGVRFDKNMLYVSLNDGREICLPVDRIGWLDWLAKATPEQQENWSLESGGFAIYWDDLDDGIEVCHLLSLQPLS